MANKRVIDANDALEVLCNYCGVEGCCPEGGCIEYQKISKLPTVDAVEVVHGRWLNAQVETGDPFGYSTYEIDVFICSVCGVHFDVSECRNYCPNCGAKMDGGNEDV